MTTYQPDDLDGRGDDPRPLAPENPTAHSVTEHFDGLPAEQLPELTNQAILNHSKAAHEALVFTHAWLLAIDHEDDADKIADAGRLVERINHAAAARLEAARRTRRTGGRR